MAKDENPKWATAALLIRVQTISMDDVSVRLKTQPTDRYSHGQRKKSESGIWSLWSGLELDCELYEHIAVLVNFIREHLTELKELEQICHISLSCGFGSTNGQGSFNIKPDALLLLGQLGIWLTLDLYPPGDFDERV